MQINYTISKTEFDKAICYFAFANLKLIEKEINYNSSMSINDFKVNNRKAIKAIYRLVSEEFDYDIPYEVVNASINLYFKSKK